MASISLYELHPSKLKTHAGSRELFIKLFGEANSNYCYIAKVEEVLSAVTKVTTVHLTRKPTQPFKNDFKVRTFSVLWVNSKHCHAFNKKCQKNPKQNQNKKNTTTKKHTKKPQKNHKTPNKLKKNHKKPTTN